MRDSLNFTFDKGYFNLGNTIDVPENCLMATSQNVLYDGMRLVSFKGLKSAYEYGGTRTFSVDKDTVVLLGDVTDGAVTEAFGNAVQAVGKSLWFVGNNLTNGFRVLNAASNTLMQIGGINHIETLTLTGSAANLAATEVTPNETTDNFTANAHTFVTGDTVKFKASSTLPTGLVKDKQYYALPQSSTQLKLLTNYYNNVVGAGTASSVDYILVGMVYGTGLKIAAAQHGDLLVLTTARHGLLADTNYRLLFPKVVGTVPPFAPTVLNNTSQYFYGRLTLETNYKSVEVTANSTTSKFTKSSHGFENDDLVRLTSTGTYPSGLNSTTPYYIYGKTTNDFQLVTEAGNSATLKTFATVGSGTLTIAGGTIATITPGTFNADDRAYGGTVPDITAVGTGVTKITRNSVIGTVYRFTANTSDVLTTVEDNNTAVAKTNTYVRGDDVRVSAVEALPNGLNPDISYKVLKTGTNTFSVSSTYKEYTITFTQNSPTLTVTGGTNSINLNDIFVFTSNPPSVFSTNTLYYVVSKTSTTIELGTNTFATSVVTPTTSGSSVIKGGTLGVFSDNGSGIIKCNKNPFVAVTVSTPKLPNSVTVQVEVDSGDTLTAIAKKIRDGLRSNEAIATLYYVSYSGADVVLTAKNYQADNSLNISFDNQDVTGPTDVATSTTTQVSQTNDSGALETTPQFCKWNGTYWEKPVQVGLPELDETNKPELVVTSSLSRSEGFSGLVQGSRTVKVARKRYGAISIASPSSNLVTASETGDSLIVSIPELAEDGGSPKSANSWILYFTYKGLGSTDTHNMFPLEIPEEELDGSVNPVLRTVGNAKYKVISQGSVQSERIVEVEFLDNDLFLIGPETDFYPADSCKFIAKLGSVMCLIGTGEDLTGFDVSYPNYYEAYPPDWANWLEEVPVSIATTQDLGFFWICTANQTYTAQITGVTEGVAPVQLEKKSSIYGCIGEGATVCVNGMLFSLSAGKTPVMLAPDGRTDDTFGMVVKGYFTASGNFNEKTRLIWDEKTNSVIYACGTKAITYQLDTKLWSAPLTLGALTPAFNNCLSLFTYGGTCYVSQFDADADKFKSFKWNDTNNIDSTVNWIVTSSFQFGQSFRNLKDIIQVDSMISSEASGNITFYARKNNSLAGEPTELATITVASGSNFPVRTYAEDLDYDSVSAEIRGTRGGQTIHNAIYTVDVHRIERVS